MICTKKDNYPMNPRNALAWAIRTDDVRLLEELVRNSVELDNVLGSENALIASIKHRSTHCAVWILEKAVRNYVLEADVKGWTPLMHAVFEGQNELLEKLIPCSRVNIKNNRGDTALIIAASQGNVEAVRILAGVSDVDAQNRNEASALMTAAACGERRCVEVLVEYCDLKTVDEDDMDALLWVFGFCG